MPCGSECTVVFDMDVNQVNGNSTDCPSESTVWLFEHGQMLSRCRHDLFICTKISPSLEFRVCVTHQNHQPTFNPIPNHTYLGLAKTKRRFVEQQNGDKLNYSEQIMQELSCLSDTVLSMKHYSTHFGSNLISGQVEFLILISGEEFPRTAALNECCSVDKTNHSFILNECAWFLFGQLSRRDINMRANLLKSVHDLWYDDLSSEKFLSGRVGAFRSFPTLESLLEGISR